MSRASPQLLCFSYHKTGTSLLFHVMTKVCAALNLKLANHYGRVEHLGTEADIVLLPHSLLTCPLDRPYRAIRLIRDPRDIWVSGYLYHLRCDEGWCTNAAIDASSPIGWPQVDYSVIHRSEAWKRGYLERLESQSYQQNLRNRSRTEGLNFELQGYTSWTLEAMRDWPTIGVDGLDIKLEDVMSHFDNTMRRIFAHFGFSPEQTEAGLAVARTEDVRRMDDASIARRPQISSRRISKWREMLSPEQIAWFEDRYGDLIQVLGYEVSSRSSAAAEQRHGQLT